MNYTPLNEFLDIICQNRKKSIHINITSDIFLAPELQLNIDCKEHTKPFCTIAKKTEEGYRLCLQCKSMSISKAMRTGKAFCGHCPFGLYEYVKPVVFNGKIICIIYIGNMVFDQVKSLKKLTTSCRLTQTNQDILTDKLNDCDYINDISEAESLALLVDSYIRMLITNADLKNYKSNTYSYRVSELKEYIWANHTKNITLKQIAKTYYTNEKYLGRLFKKETGVSVHEYINDTRLNRAAHILKNSTDSILSISIECGFANISHFNRSFKKKYGITPSQYRTQNSKQSN